MRGLSMGSRPTCKPQADTRRELALTRKEASGSIYGNGVGLYGGCMTNSSPCGLEADGSSAGSETFGNEGDDVDDTATLRVVLVDDSLEVRRRVAESLSEVQGVVIVGQAGDVPSGLRLLSEQQPDVLILDIELPGQSG